jgi:hypothetical protein
MTPFLFLAYTLANTSIPLARYAHYAAANPSLQVHYSVSLNGGALAEGSFKFHRPDLLLAKASGSRVDYTLSITPKDYLEFEGKSEDDSGAPAQEYDEYPPAAQIYFNDTDISPWGGIAIPSILLADNLKRYFSPKTTVTREGANDMLYDKLTGRAGVSETWAMIDSEGKILSLRRKTASQMGTQELAWKFSDYKKLTDISERSFEAQIPLGFKPHSVQRLARPLPIGAATPTSGWIQNGKPIDLRAAAGHKPFLLIYTESDSIPGQAAVKWSKGLSGLPVFVIAPGGISDPDGKRLNLLRAPGSPMFYLIDGAGKVKKLWFGFDPDQATEFKSDVLQAAKG